MAREALGEGEAAPAPCFGISPEVMWVKPQGASVGLTPTWLAST